MIGNGGREHFALYVYVVRYRDVAVSVGIIFNDEVYRLLYHIGRLAGDDYFVADAAYDIEKSVLGVDLAVHRNGFVAVGVPDEDLIFHGGLRLCVPVLAYLQLDAGLFFYRRAKISCSLGLLAAVRRGADYPEFRCAVPYDRKVCGRGLSRRYRCGHVGASLRLARGEHKRSHDRSHCSRKHPQRSFFHICTCLLCCGNVCIFAPHTARTYISKFIIPHIQQKIKSRRALFQTISAKCQQYLTS